MESPTKTVPFLKEEDGKLVLDKSHNYFYQIQGNLFCTGATVCDLIVYTFKDLKTIRVDRDEQFIQIMVTKLQEFYKKNISKMLFFKGFSTESLISIVLINICIYSKSLNISFDINTFLSICELNSNLLYTYKTKYL